MENNAVCRKTMEIVKKNIEAPSFQQLEKETALWCQNQIIAQKNGF